MNAQSAHNRKRYAAKSPSRTLRSERMAWAYSPAGQVAAR